MDQHNKVFVSYSHKDKPWLARLQVHLKPLVRDGLIDLWDDTRITPGQRWNEEIQKALKEARVAILLISADFLASDFINDNELPPLLAAAEQGGVVIMPLIISPSRFGKTSLSEFQSVNPPNHALIEMEEAEQEAWLVKVSDAVEVALARSVRMEERHAVTSRQGRWNVPPKNFAFAGREALLDHIHEVLTHRGRAMLSGLGGIGKTQLALEYAHRQRAHFKAVLWVAADTQESLKTGFANLARVLDLPAQHDRDQQQTIRAVAEWLDLNEGWLLIFDGADEPEWLEPLLLDPTGRLHRFLREAWGHVFITTRARQAQRLGFPQGIEATKMTPKEALAFFSLRMGRDLSASEERAASALVEELDGLPLALEQAAAFMVQIQCSIEDYLAGFRKQRLALLGEAEPVMVGTHKPLATTWSLNFEAVEKQSPAAADLLRLSAFLAPVDIPLELLTAGAQETGPALAEALGSAASDPLAVSRMLEPLTRYSLIQRDVAQRTFSLHRLVQEVVRSQMPPADRRAWAERMVRVVNRAFPTDIYARWNSIQRLLPHAVQTTVVIAALGLETGEAVHLLDRAGRYMFELHTYSDATSLYTHASDLARRVYGEQDARYSAQLVNLARVATAQKEFDKARHLLDQAIEIDRQALGPNHYDFAITLSEAARLDQSMGDYASALQRFQQAQKILVDAYGDVDVNVAAGWHNLALLHQERGELKAAAEYYGWALQIYRTLLDDDDPRIATTEHNLGALMRKAGRYAPALEHFRLALDIRRKAMPGSKDFIDSLLALAGSYSELGNHHAAATLFEEALAVNREVYGAPHPNALFSLTRLAGAYAGMGNVAEAERLYREHLDLHAQTVGEQDKRYTASLYNLGRFYVDVGKFVEAEKVFDELIAAERLFLPPDDPQFLLSRAALANLYERTDRSAEAIELYEDLIAVRRTNADDTRNLSVERYQLAQLYMKAKTNYPRAEELLLEVVDMERNTLGDDHPDLAMTLNALAWLHELTGKYREAQENYEHALGIQGRAFGQDHPVVRKTMGYLSNLLTKRKE